MLKKATAEPWHYFGTIKIVDGADGADEPKQKRKSQTSEHQKSPDNPVTLSSGNNFAEALSRL